LDNPQHVGDGVGNYILKPNMFANVQWSFAPENDAILAVPKQAVIRSGKHDRVVLALGDGQYKSVQIQIGRDFDDVFEVLYGLDDGDEVVISAQFLLDSESSITSDFMRMIPTVHAAEPEDSELSAWTQATVNDIDLERRRVNLSHGYLDAFEMMGMTMDFTIAHDIDVNEFVVGETVHVEIIRESSGMFQVRTLHRMKGMGHTKEHRGNE
jgi:membrane fusion protein, copper/silver efflux system